MEFREIIRGLLWIVTASSFGLGVLSFWTLHRMKSVPKKQRNLVEYSNLKQYSKLGFAALIISAVTLIIVLLV